MAKTTLDDLSALGAVKDKILNGEPKAEETVKEPVKKTEQKADATPSAQTGTAPKPKKEQVRKPNQNRRTPEAQQAGTPVADAPQSATPSKENPKKITIQDLGLTPEFVQFVLDNGIGKDNEKYKPQTITKDDDLNGRLQRVGDAIPRYIKHCETNETRPKVFASRKTKETFTEMQKAENEARKLRQQQRAEKRKARSQKQETPKKEEKMTTLESLNLSSEFKDSEAFKNLVFANPNDLTQEEVDAINRAKEEFKKAKEEASSEGQQKPAEKQSYVAPEATVQDSPENADKIKGKDGDTTRSGQPAAEPEEQETPQQGVAPKYTVHLEDGEPEPEPHQDEEEWITKYWGYAQEFAAQKGYDIERIEKNEDGTDISGLKYTYTKAEEKVETHWTDPKTVETTAAGVEDIVNIALQEGLKIRWDNTWSDEMKAAVRAACEGHDKLLLGAPREDLPTVRPENAPAEQKTYKPGGKDDIQDKYEVEKFLQSNCNKSDEEIEESIKTSKEYIAQGHADSDKLVAENLAAHYLKAIRNNDDALKEDCLTALKRYDIDSISDDFEVGLKKYEDRTDEEKRAIDAALKKVVYGEEADNIHVDQEEHESSADEETKKKAEDTADKPAEENADKPAEENADKPAEENADKPAEENADKPAEENADKPAEENADKPAEENADKPAEENTDKPAEENADKPAEENADKPAEENADKPAEENADKPAEEKVEEAEEKEPVAQESAPAIEEIEYPESPRQTVVRGKMELYLNDPQKAQKTIEDLKGTSIGDPSNDGRNFTLAQYAVECSKEKPDDDTLKNFETTIRAYGIVIKRPQKTSETWSVDTEGKQYKDYSPSEKAEIQKAINELRGAGKEAGNEDQKEHSQSPSITKGKDGRGGK